MTSYAMTEALPICSNPFVSTSQESNPSAATCRDLHSVGPPAGPEVLVVDASGDPVACEQEGEVVVRGSCVPASTSQRVSRSYL